MEIDRSKTVGVKAAGEGWTKVAEEVVCVRACESVIVGAGDKDDEVYIEAGSNGAIHTRAHCDLSNRYATRREKACNK